ncbi:MAG: anthranilate synthase component II [Saprospiraceae bacterium]
MKILVLDNYDSFTYNLVHYVEEVTSERPDVFRNDEITLAEASRYDKILLSPGPGLPSESGILRDLVGELAPVKSIFGVCLGLQAIGEAFGGELENLSQVFHGVATPVHIRKPGELLFRKVPETFAAGRYHSWVVSKNNLPDCFDLTCEDDKGQIMGLTHKQFDLRGVQFHPESVMTEHGRQMIKNWIFN